ncbi:MAG: serine/threonine protein kinase [Anaerolineae bacterium]|nr:serine/threonine protein kinase [Anaerolineae bacterium]
MVDKLIGMMLDDYRVEDLLGRGAAARIYRATDTAFDRQVALKIMHQHAADDPEYVTRFKREARAIASLQHPHIIELYRYGQAEGYLYMAMAYIAGLSLSHTLAYLREQGQFIKPEALARIVRQTAAALDYAHGQGIIHRDVKPANIMLDDQMRVVLADFGLALLTSDGTRGETLGTPHYLAPEQAISSANAVPQSDLYSLGVILFEALTGQRPFESKRPVEVALLHITQKPPAPRSIRPSLSPEVEALLLKAIEKQPEDRFQSGTELADALDAALSVVSSLPAASAAPDEALLEEASTAAW